MTFRRIFISLFTLMLPLAATMARSTTMLMPTDSIYQYLDSIINKPYYYTAYKQTKVPVRKKRRRKTTYKTVTTAVQAKRSFSIGCCVYDLTDNRMIYSFNPNKLMTPASTQKLFVATAFLNNAGKGYTFDTDISIDKRIGTDSVGRRFIDADLYLNTSCDPTIEKDHIKRLAEMVMALGHDSINGRIVLCQSKKTERTKKDGESIAKQLAAMLKADSIAFSLDPNWTVMPGIQRGRHVVAKHSTPAFDILERMLKMSNNTYAESVLLNMLKDNDEWSYDRCCNKVDEMMCSIRNRYHSKDSIGTMFDSYYTIKDGSGLSHSNKSSAMAQVDLLRFIYSKRDLYTSMMKLLPIAGVDGTLKKRMTTGPALNKVHAKTGTLTGVSTLAGFATAANGHQLAFSILINNCSDKSFAHNLQDKICELLTEE